MTDMKVVMQKIDHLTNEVQSLKNMQTKGMAELNLKIDQVIKLLNQKASPDLPKSSSFDLATINCPLSSSDQLEEFNQNLGDPEFKQKLVSSC